MKLGATNTLGAQAILGGEPYALRSKFIVDRLLTTLGRFAYDHAAGTGFLRTLTRLTGQLDDEAIRRLIGDAGTPAMFVHIGGGRYQIAKGSTSGNHWQKTITVSVVCIASDYSDRRYRLEGRTVHEPGLDNMVAWATFFGGRELLQIEKLKNARPTVERYVTYDSEHFVGMVQFEGEIAIDWKEDSVSTYLERLGICHSPRKPTTLFEDDNLTPATDSPTSVKTGYTEL